MRNAQGEAVGSATLAQEADGVRITVQASRLTPGPHGFHVHAVGKCEPPAFTSAGGHFNPRGQSHPNHAGDLPVLLANANGNAALTFKTDRFKVEDLFDADGSAFIIHAAPDNYANIPKDRYRPDPDAATLATGDAGGRAACGVITR
ncbi:MAG: superoxide dismutase family protein [Deltaproteobacteria bacterium]|nr:superoxide dismutase family protein [Deltaproteobacteria bacterium]